MIEEVRGDQVVYDGEVALVEHLLKGTAINCVLFSSVDMRLTPLLHTYSHGDWNLLVRLPCSAQ